MCSLRVGADGARLSCRSRAVFARGHVFPRGDTHASSGGHAHQHVDGHPAHPGCRVGIESRMVVFGEDVGPKGGVHGATLGLQEKYGVERVFDTSLSEEGIIGRAVGMSSGGPAARGGDPVPQVRRSGGGAAQRLRHHALADPESIRARRWWCGCRAGSSSAATPGTARRTRWPGFMASVGMLPCPLTPRMRWGCCAPRCGATIR
jgi:hypothetical protein